MLGGVQPTTFQSAAQMYLKDNPLLKREVVENDS